MLRKKTAEIFGADNWLEEEVKRESRISAWDMDGGKQLRMEHEENCDARNLAAQHALDCEAEENAAQHRREHRAEQLAPGYRNAFRAGSQPQENTETRKIMPWMVFAVMICIFMIIVLIPYLIPLLPIVAVAMAVREKNKNKR